MTVDEQRQVDLQRRVAQLEKILATNTNLIQTATAFLDSYDELLQQLKETVDLAEAFGAPKDELEKPRLAIIRAKEVK